MRVIGFDHVVLICRDVEASLDFYGGVLGLESVDVDEWRNGRASSRRCGSTTPRSSICCRANPTGRTSTTSASSSNRPTCTSWRRRADLKVVEGPVRRGGARGQGWSVYVLDPDAHLIELKQYGTDAAGQPAS